MHSTNDVRLEVSKRLCNYVQIKMKWVTSKIVASRYFFVIRHQQVTPFIELGTYLRQCVQSGFGMTREFI